MVVKPTFIGVGGHKCASTWISECLREHPSVFMSNPKEIGYFTQHFGKGLDWYLKFFEHADTFQHKGEFSATYLYEPDIPKKMMSQLGPVKIICLVRNPVDRTISHLKQMDRKNHVKVKSKKFTLQEFKEVEKKYPELVDYSLYEKGILNYINTFGTDNVLVLDQSTFRGNSDIVLKTLFDFLEIEFHNLKTKDRVVSRGIIPKYKVPEQIRIRLYDFFYKNAPQVINMIKKVRLDDLYRNLNSSNSDTFALDDEVILYLENKFKEDWERTQSLACSIPN